MSANNVSANSPTPKIIPRDMRQPLSPLRRGLAAVSSATGVGVVEDFECYLISELCSARLTNHELRRVSHRWGSC